MKPKEAINYLNGKTIRFHNRRITSSMNNDLIGVIIQSYLPKTEPVLSNCFERGNYTNIHIGLSRESALALYDVLKNTLEKDMRNNPDKWENI